MNIFNFKNYSNLKHSFLWMRIFVYELFFKLGYIIFILLFLRIGILYHLDFFLINHSIEDYQFILYQDSIALLIIILGAQCLELTLRLIPFKDLGKKIRIGVLAVYFCIVGIISTINYRFFELFDANLNWEELKTNLNSNEIWISIESEINITFVLCVLLWVIISIFWYKKTYHIEHKAKHYRHLLFHALKNEIQHLRQSLKVNKDTNINNKNKFEKIEEIKNLENKEKIDKIEEIKNLENIEKIDKIEEIDKLEKIDKLEIKEKIEINEINDKNNKNFIHEFEFLDKHHHYQHIYDPPHNYKNKKPFYLNLFVSILMTISLVSLTYTRVKYAIERNNLFQKTTFTKNKIIFPEHLSNFITLFFLPDWNIKLPNLDLELYKSPDKKNLLNSKVKFTITPKFEYGFKNYSWLEKDKNISPIAIKRSSKYNIVLILLESSSAAYFKNLENKNGAPITPTWQKLQKNALVFNKHYSEHPLSIQALFTVLTSAYSMPGEIWVAHTYPKIEIPSIPSILKLNNFTTAYMHPGDLGYVGQEIFLKKREFDNLYSMHKLYTKEYPNKVNWGYDDRVLINPAINLIKEAKKNNKNFFIMLAPLSPHHPYQIPSKEFEIIKSLEDLKFSSSIANIGSTHNWFFNYINSLHYSDFVLSKIVSAIESVDDNTIFFILGDHGEAFAQHRGNFNHPFYIYEENVHVPFIIYNKKLFSKSIQYNNLSSHIDILPTILDFLGLKSKKLHEGISLIRGSKPRLISFSASWRNNLVGLRDSKWKYIYNIKNGTDELFNLENDPYELVNLANKEIDLTKNYRDYIIQLTSYQRWYFESVIKRRINWFTKFDKSKY